VTNEILLVIACFLNFPLQSYDSGFGQGAGRESHGEYDHHVMAST